MFTALLNALGMAFAMGWEILWPLVLGFALSAVIQAIVSRREMSRLLPDDSPRSIGIALALGAASSSCSYAAVAIARSIFRKGANFTAAMAFEMASTNLVLELSIILIVLMGWQFMAAEAIAAPIMVAILAVLFRLFLRPQLLQAAKTRPRRALPGVSMPSLRSSPWIRGAPHSGLARLISRINWRISSGTFGLPPRDRDFHRIRLYNHQGIHNAWRNPIEAGKNETIENAKGEPLRRFSSQYIELVAQRHDLRFERGS
jgi:uncharacterized membrane protein YraQ (UPF0718 family)